MIDTTLRDMLLSRNREDIELAITIILKNNEEIREYFFSSYTPTYTSAFCPTEDPSVRTGGYDKGTLIVNSTSKYTTYKFTFDIFNNVILKYDTSLYSPVKTIEI